MSLNVPRSCFQEKQQLTAIQAIQRLPGRPHHGTGVHKRIIIRDGKELLDHWVHSLQLPHRGGTDFQCTLDFIHNSQETKRKGTVDQFPGNWQKLSTYARK